MSVAAPQRAANATASWGDAPEPSANVSPAAKLSPAPYVSTTSPGGGAAVNGPPGRDQPPKPAHAQQQHKDC